MKHNMNRVLSVVALLMMTIGTWAQSAEDVTIKVTPDGAGTVSKSVDDKGVCTLTVTPATGYYLTVDNLKAVASLKGEEMQAPKRVSMPLDNGVLEITATNADAEPTGVTTYTFTIPESSTVEVTAEFQKLYNIPEEDGVSFDAETNTLTLTNATIASGSNWAFEFGPTITAINVILQGTNTITGNAFLFKESPASLTFMTSEMAPGSLTVKDGTFVEQANTAIYCENGLAYDETGKKVSITEYGLTIGGVAVTSLNMGDVLKNGKVSFDVEQNILTLNNATIDMTQKDGYPIVSSISDLTVHLIGNNTLNTNASAAYGFIYSGEGSATLTFTHEENGFGNLKVNSGAIAQGYSVAYNTQETGWTVTESAISYDTLFGVQIGSTAFKASTLTIGSDDASATYNPSTQTLYLNNYTTTDNMTTTLEKLTISLTGKNSIGALTGNNTELTVRKNKASNEDYNKLTATSITGFTTKTIEEPLKDLSGQSGVVISDLVTYNLWVNGTQVTKENMTAVIPGVSFDGDHTLTLTDVTATCSDAAFITNGLNKLTIELLGENTVNCGNQLFLDKKEGDNDHQVTFTTDQNDAGGLTITLVESVAWYSGHNVLQYTNRLAYFASEDGLTLTIDASTVSYNLSIGNIEVTNKNAAKITGDKITGGFVSFDATSNTLTLNGATIEGNIISSRPTLIVSLKGDNTLNGGFVVGEIGKRELIFVSKDNDRLTMNADIPSGFETAYRKMLRKTQDDNKYVISLPTDYGLKVNGTKVTPENRENVLGDDGATVKFDGNNKLILNNANLNSIEMGNMELPEVNGKKTLIIHLDGDNKISNTTGQILNYTGNANDKDKYLIYLEIDANIYGSLELNYSANLSDLLFAFSFIQLTYNPKLNLSMNDIIKKLLISTKLSPIVPSSPSTPNEEDEEKTVTVVFADSKASTETLTNTVIDNILYTLNDTHQKNVADDGFVGNELVINSEVSEEDIKNAMKYVPGSDEFKKYFRGITLELPNGEGSFTLTKLYSGNEHPLCVKIGENEPIVLNLTTEPKDYEISYICSASTYVYIYLPKLTSAPILMANRRIGPKSSVAGGLGGITVKSSSMQSGMSTASNHKSMELSAMAAAISSVVDAHSGYTCNDLDITNLPDNMFLKTSTAGAPIRRGGAVETILPEGLTFVDFSNTKITGMEVSRTSGAFNGVPENVFIYMPAGNTTKEKNVVIGGICDMMELDGSDNAQPFKAMKSFKAAQATLNRSFDAGERSTVCLPYSISQSDAEKMGTFYAFDKIESDEVNMNAVGSGLSANTPYIFKAASGGLSNLQVRVVDVVAGAAGGSEFRGVYERTNYGGQDNWYCFSDEGEFVKMKSGAYVPPFRAYFVASNTNAPVLSILWDGKEDTTVTEENTTAVETVKTVADRKVAEGWWTINGMRLNAQPKKAGMYVFNGRLVVVK